jgi:hypothetical protein
MDEAEADPELSASLQEAEDERTEEDKRLDERRDRRTQLTAEILGGRVLCERRRATAADVYSSCKRPSGPCEGTNAYEHAWDLAGKLLDAS